MNFNQNNQYQQLLEDALESENQKQTYQQKIIRCGGENKAVYQKCMRELEGIINANIGKGLTA